MARTDHHRPQKMIYEERDRVREERCGGEALTAQVSYALSSHRYYPRSVWGTYERRLENRRVRFDGRRIARSFDPDDSAGRLPRRSVWDD